MIKEIYENDLGIMEGTFYSKLFGYDIIQHFNSLESEIVLNICDALKRYYE